jgi:hypothetical protein
MKTVRNAAFLILVIALMVAGRGGALAASVYPPYTCEGGCTCTVDPFDWTTVTIDCPEVAPVDECPYAWDDCSDYCFFLPAYVGGDVSCSAVEEMTGCYDPYPAMEPPTYAVCNCFCWY